ncbi:uncharacterized protein BDCG_17745 [Blastomyces dermatitidis ER-3]|uniref:Uncharacterized protein n=2 Tax=Blastomyces TaxID=229219 RepID=A0A179UH84_BLAGS|nr:uncharacterized protein BDBG_16835 [Blastomyces gilchristii SLH14081]XP_045282445.1 uncharacterized protein BDCG_17745 [Blastomyces dermatitidis ER-3]OAT02718.1 hypothetical protein BDCG_17745 [Blastomyces dermatitidis ER-3]OAT07405.1 hypothetical protein BDBG_16835 [Blastomyces gilchristii SLH14081]
MMDLILMMQQANAPEEAEYEIFLLAGVKKRHFSTVLNTQRKGVLMLQHLYIPDFGQV